MSMLNIGLSGLKTTQTALEVTSNNIANSSTAGFRSTETEFASVYNGAERSGVAVSDMRDSFDVAGEVVNTGSALDLALNGGGFFVVEEANGQRAFTYAGQFQLDSEQRIVNASGQRLQGYAVDETGNLINGVLTDLKVSAANIPAKQTENIDFALNLNSASDVITTTFDPTDGSSYNYSQSTEIFDSLGNSHTLTQYFVHTGSNEWKAHYYVDGNAITPATKDLKFGADGKLTTPVAPATISLSFDPSATTGATPMTFDVNMTDTSQYGSGFSMYVNDADGYTAGEFSGISIDTDGSVNATFTNGENLLQGQVVLADFSNLDGLESGNNTVWYETSESGAALYGAPGEGRFGQLQSGAYIGSNVDISEELVDLVSFQQNYQANAQTISSADEMMQILFNAV